MKFKNITEVERRKAFFYAEADADLYDCAAEFNTPLYGLLHSTMLDLIKYHYNIPFGAQAEEVAPLILDIGSGTGAESLALLELFSQSRVVALDLCEPMHDFFKHKFAQRFGSGTFEKRCKTLTGDVTGDIGRPELLLSQLNDWGINSKFDLVVSSLALHHLTSKEKSEVYGRIFEVLKEGGLFVNADIFTFQSPELARQGNHFLLSHIDRQFTNPDPELRKEWKAMGQRSEPMRKGWREHCEKYNIPDPIESPGDGTGTGLRHSAGPSQAEMLIRARFSQVGCPFRYWQIGILWALK